MFQIVVLSLMSVVFLYGYELIHFGKFQKDNSIFTEKEITLLTEKFLGIEYVSNTLANEKINLFQENLIINFESLDCFTFIDTVEALQNSHTKEEFRSYLIATRYKNSDISYFSRNHFFSDWIENNAVEDVTCELGKCHKVLKYLNQDEKYLQKISTKKREIAYISVEDIDISLLKNGDYIGIYSDDVALDVTHTGIIIFKDSEPYIRHASSLKKKIIDSNLLEYTASKKGILVYRKRKKEK